MNNGKRIIIPGTLACILLALAWLWNCSKADYDLQSPTLEEQKQVNHSYNYSENEKVMNNTNSDTSSLDGNRTDESKFKGKADSKQAADDNQALQRDQNKNAANTKPKRVYSGYCQLRVDSLENEKKVITDLAQSNGGYVEGIYERSISIRVPAEKFTVIFEQILGQGEVIFKRTETVDVTEAFTDLSTRLELALKTRDRLYNLLEKTEKVEERLKILREIKRLTEEIERIKLSIQLLESQIAYSRIVIDLESRLNEDQIKKDAIPFPWIGRLTPLYASLREFNGKVQLKLSEDFAVFEYERFYRAESAEGTRLRIGTTENKPIGDSEFWQKALHFHLQTYYKQAEDLSLGELKAVLFTSKDREAFAYLVGITVKHDRLYVLEVFFPDQAARTTRLESIKTALTKMKIE